MRYNTMARFDEYDDNMIYDYNIDYRTIYSTTFDTYQEAAEFVADKDPDEFTQDGTTVLYSVEDTITEEAIEDEDTALYYLDYDIPKHIMVDGVDFDLIDTEIIQVIEF